MADAPEKKTISGEAGPAALLKAALPALPVVGQLPGVRKSGGAFSGLSYTRPPVTIERDHVNAYAEVCGFPERDTVPLPYPHMLAFGLQMAIMTDPAFPAAAMGMVHLENSITQHRPIRIGETVEVTEEVGPGRPHPKGTVFDFRTFVYAAGELVWEETSTYLKRGRGDDAASWGMDFQDVAPGPIVWSLPADLGRQYARVSGDFNPIHLYPLTARALGFKRQIAHGMWTMARCVAALENRLPDAVTVDVSFRKPAFLPGKVAFGVEELADGYAFSLTKAGSTTVHVVGRTH